MRAFIAIDLREEIIKCIEQIQNDLKTVPCNIKWTAPQNLHITLKFLGDIDEKKTSQIKEAVKNIAQKTAVIKTRPTTLGTFPPGKRARIIWLGLSDDQMRISQLADELETALEHFGFEKENRPFKSHVTIGRVRSLKNINQVLEKINIQKIDPSLQQQINNVTFYKSTLTSTGPIYTPIEEFNLCL